MIILFLTVIDLLVPVIFGPLYAYLFYDHVDLILNVKLSAIYAFTIIIFSFLFNYYKDYFSVNFSEKIKISSILTLIAVIFQIILHFYLSKDVYFSTFLIWILIPIIILLVRYFISIRYSGINDISIYVVGNSYKFNDHEMYMLTSKGFKIYFYDSIKIFYTDIVATIDQDKSIIVLNVNQEKLQELNEFKFSLFKTNNISLDDFMEYYLRKIYIHDDELVLGLRSYTRFNYILKRSIDYISAVILSPILFVSLIVIFSMKIISNIKDPLIYTQKRYGINKNIFSLYKIRTMPANSDIKGNTEKNDTRIYPFAKFIRELRIDEFPQIINVLLGHMHLVGPRAEWIKLSDAYYENIVNYNLRHIIRPGITGWAQIIYPYGENEHDAKQKLMYELYYIKNWSIWLEIEICIKTFFVMLDKRGF